MQTKKTWTLDEWVKDPVSKDKQEDEVEKKEISLVSSSKEKMDDNEKDKENETNSKKHINKLKTNLRNRLGKNHPYKKYEKDQEIVSNSQNYSDGPQKVIIHTRISPGDIVMLTAAIRDLHRRYPKRFITDVNTGMEELWENNPYITKIPHTEEGGGKRIIPKEPDVKTIRADYPLVHECNGGAYHFIHGYAFDIAKKLGLPPIHVSKMKGDIHLSEPERSWISQVHEILDYDPPFWIVNAGVKDDYTAKGWEVDRFQQVVDALPEIWFVQIGENNPHHFHVPLKGDNVINLIGKTDLRQLIRLVYHSYGVLTGVSLPMHLAAAVPMHPRWNRTERPCIVLAGGREPSHWEAYSNHAYLHTCGMLPCCQDGGCWKSRIIPLEDGSKQDSSICERPVKTKSGQTIPKCLDMITADDVIRKICDYMNDQWSFDTNQEE